MLSSAIAGVPWQDQLSPVVRGFEDIAQQMTEARGATPIDFTARILEPILAGQAH